MPLPQEKKPDSLKPKHSTAENDDLDIVVFVTDSANTVKKVLVKPAYRILIILKLKKGFLQGKRLLAALTMW